jgi:hypothetical protein
MSIRTALALAAVLSLSPLAHAAAQNAAEPNSLRKAAPAHPEGRPPVLDHFQPVSTVSPNRTAPTREAVASDRDLTSEKIAIVVVLVVLAIVVYRAVK